MIASKEKQEEYREIKEYWEKRLEHSLDEQLKNNKPRFKKI